MKHAGCGLIVKNKKILLAKRTKTCKLFPNHWCFPGGRSEINESPEETAIREVKEEINIDFTPFELFYVDKTHATPGYYFFGMGTGKIILQESEISDCKEFSYDELTNEKIAFNHRDIIQILYEQELL